MKLIRKDYKKGYVKLVIQNLDDLWYLSSVIDIGDNVIGQTERKIKLGGEDSRNAKIIRKKITLSISAEKVQFGKESLRITGKIAEGNDDVSAGEYHTLSIESGSSLKLEKGKKGFLSFQIDKIEEASKNKSTSILIVALDRAQATFAQLKTYGYELLGTIKGTAKKKDYEENIQGNFYQDVAKQIEQYANKIEATTIVIGSVSFWKEYLKKEIDKTSIQKNRSILYTSCDSDGQNAINEIIKQPEVKTALKEERFALETKLVATVLKRISKQEKVSYGFKETNDSANNGAIETLLVTDSYIQKSREDDKYEKLEAAMRNVDSANGKVVLVSSEHEAGEQLDGLGGIAGLLRF